ncbi:MAG TPA: hypothetical protein VLA23_01150 [Candidatus Limnocylindrales bacterium]|nr:hypothetical protein [Candidatus Limnocylindrales bacterium]
MDDEPQRGSAPGPLTPIDERLTPIDPDAPVSGHRPGPSAAASLADAPEHDWEAARGRVFPLLRPAGTGGTSIVGLDTAAMAAEGLKTHAQPLVDEGPGGLAVLYALASEGFDILVNADHLLSWGVAIEDLQDAAVANLASWAAGAPWSDERSADHRLLSSQTGEGWDASRIILPETTAFLATELGGDGRVLVGLPDRHLLVAAALRPGDEEFAERFASFVLEQAGDADEPIERRAFELIGLQLVPFAG